MHFGTKVKLFRGTARATFEGGVFLHCGAKEVYSKVPFSDLQRTVCLPFCPEGAYSKVPLSDPSGERLSFEVSFKGTFERPLKGEVSLRMGTKEVHSEVLFSDLWETVFFSFLVRKQIQFE